jgi:acyl-CoA synthetase (AMP-forming)/AMP-acid ligase II
VCIVWTSGSTGRPKGALFDHRNLAAVSAGTDVLSEPGDRRLSPLPFAHVGYMTRIWDEIAHRITTVVTPQPWSAADAIALLSGEQVTVGQGVPTQWALVLRHPDLGTADLSSLRVAGTGAARVPAELVREMRRRLACPVVVRYTSTESSLGTGTVPGDPDEVVCSTVGRPVPGVDLAIVGESGRPVPSGEVGRVRLRSAAVMRGYVATRADLDRKATEAVLDAAGWLTTGDLGWVDDSGNLHLVGRQTEMYIRGGYNVYPSEVEAVLRRHPGVTDVTVVGLDDPVLGEIGAAFVVPAATTPSLEELRAWCCRELADYKAPDRLFLLDALPLTPMGKVDNRALRSGSVISGTRGAR